MANPTDASAPNSFDTGFLLDQARGYLAFGEQIAASCANAFRAVKPQRGADWGAVLRQNFDQLKTAIAESADGPGVNPELARLWNQTLDLWQQTATSLGIVRADGGETDAWQAYRQVAEASTSTCCGNAAKSALDLMEKQLGERVGAGQTIDSLRELYNLWVDCNEKTYGQMLRGAEYSRTQRSPVQLLAVLVSAEKSEYPMIGLTPNGSAEELQGYSARMTEGLQTLRRVGEIEAGVSPRDPVYREDKLVLYRYRPQVAKAAAPCRC
jgi:hypothetical protein